MLLFSNFVLFVFIKFTQIILSIIISAGPDQRELHSGAVYLLSGEGIHERCLLCAGLLSAKHARNRSALPAREAVFLYGGGTND